MLIDSHAHVHDEQFDADRPLVLRRAWEAGLSAIITVGTDTVESRKAVHLAQQERGIYATVGVHPHDAKLVTTQMLEELMTLARLPKVVAIGETGLDFYRMLSPRQAQMEAFTSQLALAAEVGLPVVIHSREASKETYAVLSRWAATQSGRDQPLGVLHCYSGDLTLARRCAEIGFLISIAGPVTYPKNTVLRQVAAELPLSNLMVETDCPYLPPQSHRGRRNEPAYLVETVQQIATLRSTPYETVARATVANTMRLFRISDDGGIPAGTPGRITFP